MPYLYNNLGIFGGGFGNNSDDGSSMPTPTLQLGVNDDMEMEATSDTITLSTDPSYNLYIERSR